ncbi:MAG: asparagine--tRNA ligase [Mycoplasmataceae bacterium]|nr:asparagine--tRNA ligase [Mycoplasmataceae bacterium]
MIVTEIIDIIKKQIPDGSKVNVHGWVKSTRHGGKISFIELNDGSSLKNLQIVAKIEETEDYDQIIKFAKTGSSIMASGILKQTDKSESGFELISSKVSLLKSSDEDYPLQKKEHSLEFLRDIAHLRPRSKTFNAIFKIRSKLAFAIHQYFNENDFIWTATPILTSSDAEGAGDIFTIQESSESPLFDKKAFLTVSGQLHGEAFAQAFKKIYTFGPTFRSEHSHTFRHANEFWMIEPEVAFCDLLQLQILIEDFIKYITKYVTEHCKDELEFFFKEKPFLKERIDTLLTAEYKRVDYIEAIKILNEAVKKGVKFDDGVTEFKFGTDIGTPEERYLCEKVFNCPIFLQNLPLEMKAFYMKQNPKEKWYDGNDKLEGFSGITVAANDLLIPGVGEVIGGSQREDEKKKIEDEAAKRGIDLSSIKWYVDLRKYGYYSSSGFGLGFERMLMVLLELNIRDTIPFPRTPGTLKF